MPPDVTREVIDNVARRSRRRAQSELLDACDSATLALTVIDSPEELYAQEVGAAEYRRERAHAEADRRFAEDVLRATERYNTTRGGRR